MTLEEINNKLEEISLNIQGLPNLTNEKIEKLAEQTERLTNADEGAIFDKDIDFENFISSNLAELNSFDKIKYFEELNQKDFSKVLENQKIAKDRFNKIKELTSKIERMGKLNTIIKETQSRYSEKNFDNVLKTEDLINTSKLEKENEKITKLSNFRDEMEDNFKILDYIEEVKKLEAENVKIKNKITDLETKKIGLDPEFQDNIQKIINKEEKKIENNNEIIDAKNVIIAGRTADDIKRDIESKIPKDLDKTKIQQAINEDNPREAFNKLILNSQNQILMYQNRIDKNIERREKVDIGRVERENLKKAKPIGFNPADYSLDDDEIAAIDEEIKNGGDKIDELIKNATAEINALPVPEGKELRNQVKEWLDNQKGKTRNPFKNIARRIKSNSEKAQSEYIDAHKKQQINEKVKNALILEKQKEKFDNMIRTKRAESKAKTNTLDNMENSWKSSLRVETLKLSNDELDEIIKNKEYGKIASDHYKKVADENTKNDDNSFIH